jgi:uncharacterized protein
MAEPWYQDGLRFACQRCGNCCTGAPGFTWVTEDEIAALVARLGVTDAEFRATYTRTVWRKGVSQITLIDLGKSKNYACSFFKKGVGCTVYEDRPRQCRTWPFWRRNLTTPEDWADQAAECPGIGKGTLHSSTQIAAIAADDGLPA